MQCTSVQGEANKIQNQRFYRSTLEAMRAKEYAKLAKPEEKMQDAAPRQGSANVASGHADSDDVERPAVPPAKASSEEMEEIPIAGRTKMTVPKNKDKGVQDSSSSSGSDSEAAKEQSVDHLDAESELNSILKRSPSEFVLCDLICLPDGQDSSKTHNCEPSSHHLFQILLSLQQESEVNPARSLHYLPETVCRRVGPTPDWVGPPGSSGTEHRTPDSSQCPGKWEEHWRWRRHRWPGPERRAGIVAATDGR